MKPVLQPQQKLKLSMTPGLRQAIEMLQYSTAELEEYIREQEMDNPLIELKEKDKREPVAANRSFNNSQKPARLAEVISENDENTRDSLYLEAKLIYTDQSTRKRLKFIIYNLDDNGYLSSLGDAPAFNLNEIEEAIHLLQKVGPIGIGARNLKECLLLQIHYLYPEQTSAKVLVEHHLDLLADRKWKEISSRMNISLEEIKNIQAFIQTLNPKPCSFPSGFLPEYLVPDIIVEPVNGHLIFKLNDGYLPTIHLNSCYSPPLHIKDEASQYITSQFQKFQRLLSSIEQRRNTIIKIITVLLVRQEDFFKHGFQHLNPLTLKEVADEIGMHESTVSRAVSNKVVQTPSGSLELKQLFSSKLMNSEGISVSQSKVKSLMQKFISQEDKQKPNSDQKIVDYFVSCEGVSISRRTISKYREEMKIPSASKRKEL